MRSKPKRRLKVLLAWDVEQPAPAALTLAGRLAALGAEAEAAYVLSPEFSGMSALARRTLEKTWRAGLRRHGVELRVLEGAVIARLLSWIAQRRPDFVILGTRRGGWVERAVFGSVATAVQRRSNRPVLLVPNRR